jgi:predicted homoserine dehydrogenase-like protein
VESTGAPEAAAVHADAALKNGKHVAMVSKEPDSVVGPLFHRRAKAAGLVYTPVDGDQPSLLMQLVVWARVLGLEILCAGKTSEYDCVYDATKRVTSLDRVADSRTSMSGSLARDIRACRGGPTLTAIPQHTVPTRDGRWPTPRDSPGCPLPAPIARTPEIADVLVPVEMGGPPWGRQSGCNSLRRPTRRALRAALGGPRDDASPKFCAPRATGTAGDAAMIYRPSHLLGVESATTVLSAVLHGRSSGPDDVQPRFDVIGQTTTPLPAGTLLEATGHHHQIAGVDGRLVPARAATGANPSPFYLMAGHRLLRDIPAGTVIAAEMVAPPQESVLWQLRREMEETFGLS